MSSVLKDGNSNIAEVLESVRARLRPRVEAEIRAPETGASLSPSPSADIGALQPLLWAIVSAHRQMGVANPRHPVLLYKLVQAFKRPLRRFLTWYVRPISEFQACTIQFLGASAEILTRHQSQLNDLEQEVELLRTDLSELRQFIQAKLNATPHDQAHSPTG